MVKASVLFGDRWLQLWIKPMKNLPLATVSYYKGSELVTDVLTHFDGGWKSVC